jgi:hypothetical protein
MSTPTAPRIALATVFAVLLPASGCAAAPRVVDVPPALAAAETPPPAEPVLSVADVERETGLPFGTGEETVKAPDLRLKGGVVDEAAYLYSADRRHALVASRPGQGPEVLGYEAHDWFIECGPGDGGNECNVRMAGAERTDRPLEDALRIHFDPVRQDFAVCVGPPGTGPGAALRVGDGPWHEAAADGCYDADTSRQLVTDLKAGDSYEYHYTGPEGADVRGWYPAFGLRQALDLAGWLAAPPARTGWRGRLAPGPGLA